MCKTEDPLYILCNNDVMELSHHVHGQCYWKVERVESSLVLYNRSIPNPKYTHTHTCQHRQSYFSDAKMLVDALHIIDENNSPHKRKEEEKEEGEKGFVYMCGESPPSSVVFAKNRESSALP